MKGYCLRGLCLGLSLALILSGGVALAQGSLYVTADKECINCVPEGGVPGEENSVTIVWGGWTPGDYLCNRWTVDSQVFRPTYCMVWQSPPPASDPPYYFPCEYEGNKREASFFWGESAAADAITTFLGKHTVRIWEENPPGTTVDSAKVSFLVADDCEALEEEFVPEPGTILLLGSGLAGLAGYASLRWSRS